MAGMNLEGSMNERAGRYCKGSGTGIFSIPVAGTLDDSTANSGSALTLPVFVISSTDEISPTYLPDLVRGEGFWLAAEAAKLTL